MPRPSTDIDCLRASNLAAGHRPRRRLALGAGLVLAALASSALAAAPVPGPSIRPAPPAKPAPPEDAPARPGRPDRPETPSRPAPPDRGASRPPVRADPPSINFGFVPPKSVNKGIFKLWNTGDAPLEIVAVQPSCKCTTTTDLVGHVIAPGEYAELEAVLEAAPAVGLKGAHVKVLFDGYTDVIELGLRADVTLPIKVSPGYINAVRGGSETGRITAESIDGKPFRICSVHGRTPSLVGFDPEKDEPRSKYLIQYDLTEFPAGGIPRYLVIETDRPDCPLVDLLVRHDSLMRHRLIRGVRDLRTTVGVLPPGEPGEVTIGFQKTGRPLTFDSVRSLSPDAAAELVSQEGDEEAMEVVVKMTPREGLLGFFYAPIILSAGGQELEVIVFGRVAPDGAGCVAPTGGTRAVDIAPDKTSTGGATHPSRR